MQRQRPRRRETLLLRAVAPLLALVDLRGEEERGVQEIWSVGEHAWVGAHQTGWIEGQATREADGWPGIHEERARRRRGQLRHRAGGTSRWCRVAESLVLR